MAVARADVVVVVVLGCCRLRRRWAVSRVCAGGGRFGRATSFCRSQIGALYTVLPGAFDPGGIRSCIQVGWTSSAIRRKRVEHSSAVRPRPVVQGVVFAVVVCWVFVHPAEPVAARPHDGEEFHELPDGLGDGSSVSGRCRHGQGLAEPERAEVRLEVEVGATAVIVCRMQTNKV